LITEIYEIIRSIKDPEHPYTLEQLDVISEKDISVEMKNNKKYVTVFWKPPGPNCGYAAHIGMAIIIKLER
jgi:metal-sulfur cluster biosynthetic enzyme